MYREGPSVHLPPTGDAWMWVSCPFGCSVRGGSPPLHHAYLCVTILPSSFLKIAFLGAFHPFSEVHSISFLMVIEICRVFCLTGHQNIYLSLPAINNAEIIT